KDSVANVRDAPDPHDIPDQPDNDAARLRNALAGNEFCLFFQAIESVAADAAAVPFREILLRLKAEEENMLPPGSFLPVAEQHGMLPDLDRWVVRHLLGWVRGDSLRQRAVYSINLSIPTVADAGFPDFVADALREFALPGSLLCFELQESGALSQPADVLRFVRRLQPLGCRIALCGFNGDRVSLDLLRRIPVNFLKIDGTLILHMRRSAIDQARVKAIQRVAKAIGIGTIAECVEDNKTLARLRAIGVDYAQGFAVSLPQPLRDIANIVPVPGADAFVARHPGRSVAG
ncbi:MAG: EAL domain-containing protein, partial [Betaproteobacteria bacterium]